MNLLEWAEKEVELACKKENPNWDGKTFDYGCTCYQSALKAFKTLCEDGHSGLSIQFTKLILDKLIDGKALTPITDEDFIIDDNLPRLTGEDLKKCGLKSKIQCPRMSSLFRYEDLEGTITYNDVERAVCKDSVTGSTYHYGFADKLVNGLYPITMPYIPSDKPYIVVMEQFKYNKNDTKNDWDIEGIFYIIEPDGETKTIINKYYKFHNDDRTEITEEEYLERKLSQ